MKYLLFWEQEDIDPEERARISRRAREERRNEERYGRVVLPPHFYVTSKGVTVVEIDDPRRARFTRREFTLFEDKDMDWTVQNVIDSKDQMRFKVLLSSRIPAPR